MKRPGLTGGDIWRSLVVRLAGLDRGCHRLLGRRALAVPQPGSHGLSLAVYPDLPTSAPYNCLVGHLVGIGSGFAAVAVFNAWSTPIVPLHDVGLRRLGAAALAIGLTVLLNQLLHSGHPPAAAAAPGGARHLPHRPRRRVDRRRRSAVDRVQ